MMIIRPVSKKDIPNIASFSSRSLLGMTNLPRNQEKLEEKILHSEESFCRSIDKPGSEHYFFVIEDLQTGKIGGTCGILSNSMQSFLYHYRIKTFPITHAHALSPKEMKILKITKNQGNASEVCALYLQPLFRHSGNGRLLSLSRFLFIAKHRHRFKKKITAEMRGYIDEQGNSPFWEMVGRHFCPLSFAELMSRIEEDHAFVPQILPRYPIYIDLLPQAAQDVIGKIHNSTNPAYHMLLQENFSYHGDIDIFEGGPILSCLTSRIRTIKESTVIQTDFTSDSMEEESVCIIANEKLSNFRACMGKIHFLSKVRGVINKETAEALLIKPGDSIRMIATH